ncbi:unnamed protein product [Arctia plantaginis]|uniref:XRCC4 N-terminal domain-containing protein n=1 Tax=Arctia plantaginis TaxID=874455 RepID=A0A8S1ABV6_ARCPL|nr:unnamed protein product [Arctia plantaginis]
MEKTPSMTRFNINEKFLYVKVFWQPNENDLFNIKMYDGKKAWSGRFSYEFARKYQERLDETEEKYQANVKEALRKDPKFIYSFTLIPDDNTSATFSWKKKIKGTDTVVHGCVPVHRDDTKETRAFILDFLLAENQDLRKTVESVNLRNAELAANLDKCKKDLDKFVGIKTSLELSFYDKFEQLLNAKKKRMRLLEITPHDATTNVNNIEEEII